MFKINLGQAVTTLRQILNPNNWNRPTFAILGAFFGLFVSVFYISNAMSYLSDDPLTCVNCHVMNPHYATWEHSSHRIAATCNDCHVPHNNIIRKYYFKANDGLRHSFYFTFNLQPQAIRIKDAGITVVQENCLRCHINQVNPVAAADVSGKNYKNGEGKLCWGCHREVPHGRTLSEASTPNARIPQHLPKAIIFKK